jgi:hypothetical protein
MILRKVTMHTPSEQRGANETHKQNNGDKDHHDLFAVDGVSNLFERRLFFAVTALSFDIPDLRVFFGVFASTRKMEPISRQYLSSCPHFAPSPDLT